jgi:SAM-dependent methyltransferase
MKVTEYQNMAEREDSYWWHTGRLHIIRKQLNRLQLKPNSKLLNIGSGTGGTIPLLEQYGSVKNIETSDDAIAFCRAKGFHDLDKPDGLKLPYPDNTFDAAVAFDVLEHIAEDEAALIEWRRVLKPGGSLMITVPAYQWLWSEHDESLHHQRRYTASRLHQMLNQAGYQVTKKTYAIVFSFPLIVLYRLFRSLAPRPQKSDYTSSYVLLPKPINACFSFLLRIEGSILKYINLPFGTSVLIVGRKK